MQKLLLTFFTLFSISQLCFGQCGVGAPSDDCTTATPLNLSAPFSGSTECITPFTVSPENSWCGSIENDSWFIFTAGAETLDIDWEITGGSDCVGTDNVVDPNPGGIQISIYKVDATGGGCGGGAAAFDLSDNVACLNPTGGVGYSGTFNITGLTIEDEFFLRIDGYTGDECNYTITPKGGVAVMPDNDLCVGAKVVTCAASVTADNIFATATDAPTGCTGGGTPNLGVWYKFVGDGSEVTVDTDDAGTSFDTEINVYSGSCGALVCVGGDDDGGAGTTSSYTFTAANGTDYYIYVDGIGGDIGGFVFNVTCAASCLADVGGTPTTTQTGDGTNNTGPYILCYNDNLGMVAPGDEVMAPAASADSTGLGYAIYACAPTTNAPGTDPCWTGYYFGGDFTSTNDAVNVVDFIIGNPGASAGASGVPTDRVFYTAVTMDDACFDTGAGCNAGFGYDVDMDGCFDINIADAIEVIYLDEITVTPVDNCAGGSVAITLNGGYPEANSSNYTITNTGAGTLSSTSAASGGSVTISGLTSGATWSISVVDDNGCPVTFSASNFCPPIVLISDPGPVSTCGASFYDTGGPTSNYSINEDYTLTICPDATGMALQVDFNSFDTEATYDNLIIYDGDDATAASLGTFSGSYSSGTFTSSHCTGCLTFFFESDYGTNDAGFDATLSCVTNNSQCCGASAVALAPSGTSTANAQCDDGDWTYYYDPAVPTDMLFAINWAPDGSLSALNTTAKAGASVDITTGATMDSKISGTTESHAMGRYWDVATSAIDEPVNVKFFYDPAEKTAVEGAAIASLLPYMGFAWFKTTTNAYTHAANNTAAGVTGVIELTAAGTGTENNVTFVQFDGITSFSGGTGSASAGNPPILPIELISFSGDKKGDVNLLEWATASEKNTERMIVERSANGLKNWEAIGEVAAYGTTDEKQYYELEDARPLNLGYYRLKSIDFDGAFQLSNVISIRRAVSGFEIANISPNPTKDVLNIGLVSGIDTPTTLILRDITGREIQRYEFETTTGDNNFSINLNDVSNGIYLLTIENNTHRLVEKIVKN